ncbi:very short patch repair endonuclease [Mucilaginibacter rubeus]|nr:very short patch repair endonuclease [Mucilaginibacter rubeus]
MTKEDLIFIPRRLLNKPGQQAVVVILKHGGPAGRGKQQNGMMKQRRSTNLMNKVMASIEDKPYLRDGRAPLPTNAFTSKVMRGNKAKDTMPELLLRQALYAEGLRGYRLNLRSVPGRPDIAFRKKKIAIFVHGCFWHRCPLCGPKLPKSNVSFWSQKFERNQQRDREKTEQLVEMGWQVLTIWECQLKINMKDVVRTIKDLLLK